MANKKNHPISYLLPLRLWIGKKLFGANKLGPHGVRVSPGRMIKGPCYMPELEALRYVAEHTSIPVPKVFNTHYYDDRLYIEMEYIRGMSLEKAWHRGYLSEDQKKHIINQVAGYISQLRRLEPPQEGIVASATFDKVLDHRVGCWNFGPFISHEGFHSYLRADLPVDSLGPEIAECHSRHYRSCFTHADLALRNIMVDNGKVSAIVDWQFGGWYPEYWEYTKAHYGQVDRPDWYTGLQNALEKRYDDELAAEQVLWRRLDDPQILWQGREHLISGLV
ncbi:uncharacterized protein N7518_001176 [Penicillium psychrosexuale]|uniref:uncharacterized protein n=1 Tax=Penicillium psychrosexuale TaxID=1002107 RepID=UPI002544E075|nr:uncharacterized protein N7518_001176 [Penicillium psychrosexuale]KAJ5799108.1 hypothetical protein N7518_001176 [Penicillium psychrosexuale]